MSINKEYFSLRYHMEKINNLIEDYLEPFGLIDLEYNDLLAKLEDEHTRAMKRMDPKAMMFGGDNLAKVRIKLSQEYSEWKTANNKT
jgi:uncharacterized protein YbjQ (UPF0145 family)